MIELKNIVCNLKDRELFDIKEFTFENGHSYLLKGENGSGKSTLLTAIIGYGEIVEGDIKKNGKITYQPQEIYLYKKTPIDNFKICHGDKKLQEELSYELGINTLLKKSVDVLSGGERQKVAFIRSISSAKDVLILDEPFSQMDFASRDKALRIAIDWQKKEPRRTLIIVSHDAIDEGLFHHVLTIEDKNLKKIL